MEEVRRFPLKRPIQWLPLQQKLEEVRMAIGETSEIYVQDDEKAQNYKLAERIRRRIPFERSSLPKSILHRVPDKLRIVGGDAYQPRIISIGPYHHRQKHLRGSDKYKGTYVQSILSRGPEKLLSDIVQVVREMEHEIRECYEESIKVDSEDFVTMIISDGCFILELLNKYQEEEANMESNDSIFSTSWIVPSLRRDLVLLENQIPFFVLERLYNLFKWPSQIPTLDQLVLDFFEPILPTISVSRIKYSRESKHILDLLRSCLLNQSQTKDFRDSPTLKNEAAVTYFDLSQITCFGDNPTWEYTTSATDLQAAGVKFLKKDSAKGLLDITFSGDGKLQMPPFFFGESWTVLFPNLIALEQCHRCYADKITSYVILVNKLLGSPSDVKLLRDNGIIDGSSRKDEKVIRVIGDLLEEVVADKFYFDGLCNAVNAYCRRDWNRWRRNIVRNFFRTPRHAVSFVAAAVLLLLVCTQVVFTIIS